MDHGFAILIPFSILSTLDAAQSSSKVWKPSPQQKLLIAKFLKIQFFKYALVAAYMGHGFAILIPFSMLSSPEN